jgi:hypothetical protein
MLVHSLMDLQKPLPRAGALSHGSAKLELPLHNWFTVPQVPALLVTAVGT